MKPGLSIPLYTYPGPTDTTWSAVLSAKLANWKVPFIVTMNPNSGPGSSSDAMYASAVKKLQEAEIKVLGYIATGYGKVPESSIQSQISSYVSWYDLNGFFFDQLASSDSFVTYYNDLAVMSAPRFTIGNPGIVPSLSLFGIFDVLNVSERAGLTQVPSLGIGGESGIFYSVPAVSESFLETCGLDYIYVTDKPLPNPYNALPSYFSKLASALSNPIAV